MTVRFRLLGSVEATTDGKPIALGHARLRSMLTVLLIEVNHPVTVDQFIDRVWPEAQLPNQPRRAVQHNIPLLRRALAPMPDVALTRTRAGYQLAVDPEAVDLHRFNALLAASRTGGDEHTARMLAQALELWRDEPFADLTADTPWLNTQRATLTARRHAARLDLTDIRLRQGRHTDLLADLAAETTRHPLDERLAGQYLLALYRSGQQAGALEHYHRLRGLLAEELGADASPPLRELHQRILTADPALTSPAGPPRPVPRQLPAPPSLFTGRGGELAALDRAVDDRAGTVVISAIGGVGGIGKTWLALHWAHRHQHRFPDGQLYVNLRGFDPSGTPTSVGEAVRCFLDGLGVDAATLPLELDAQSARYRSLVADRRMLIVLDNARDAEQVAPLLPGSPGCTVLVTSRHHLAGLAGARLLDLNILPESDARELLTRHLGPHRLAAEPEAAAELLAICAGLPLAIRIIAARAAQHPAFPLAVFADELRDASARLDAFDAGDLRVNLRAALSWSLRTLSPRAANLFELLGIAPGSDVSVAAATALADLPTAPTRALLRELERAALVQQQVPDRYRMHDLIRLYAGDTAQRNQAQDVRKAAQRRILDFYTHTAYAAEGLLQPHRPWFTLVPPTATARLESLSDVPAALAWFAAEHAVLLAAQQTADRLDWHHIVWQLACAMDTFHYRGGHHHDAFATWRAALGAAEHLPDPSRIIAYRMLGRTHADFGRHEEGLRHLRIALDMALASRDVEQQAHTHRIIARVLRLRTDYRQAVRHALHAIDLFRAVDQPVFVADALNQAGWYLALLGEYGAARRNCEAALGLHRENHNQASEAATLDSLGYIADRTGQHREAIDHYRGAVALYRTVGHSVEAPDTLERLGHPHLALGEPDRAREVWREALELFVAQRRDEDAARVRNLLDELDQKGV